MMGQNRSSHKLLAIVTAAALWLGVSVPAGASLIGDEINVNTECGFQCSATDNDVLVGAGVELANGDGSDHDINFFFNAGDSIDISDSAVRFSFAADSLLAGPLFFISTFTDLEWIGFPDAVGITAVTISDPNNVLNAGAQANVLTGSSFDFQGTVNISPTDAIFFDVLLTVDHNPPTVPEPGTLPLLALSLLGVIGAARRQRRRA